MTDTFGLSWRKRILFSLVALVGIPLAGLALIEGLSSLALFALGTLASGRPEQLAEGRHTRYDSLLGWVNIPGTQVPDMYGPGIAITINARGFRGAHEVTEAPRAGVTRVICSGDSFTLGYGVGDAVTWCAQLEKVVAGLETVNMGQGGYGLDQAYLWYLREGAPLAPDLHLFAFIWDDFHRVKRDHFAGYPKPLFRLDGDRLALQNVPVPTLSRMLELRRGAATAASRLRLVQFGRSVAPTLWERPPVVQDSVAWRLAEQLFLNLAAHHQAYGGSFALVYLPTSAELLPSGLDKWRDSVLALGTRRGITVIDLVPAFRQLPADSSAQFFIRGSGSRYADADGHYTTAGNRWVAEQLGARLAAAGLLPVARAGPTGP